MMKHALPLLVGLLSACATPRMQTNLEDVEDTGKAYLAGRFSNESSALLRRTRDPLLLLRALPSNEIVSLHISDEKGVTFYRLEPGRYRIEGFAITVNQSRSVGCRVPDELLTEFEVRPGTVVYLGRVAVKDKGGLVFAPYLERVDDLDAAKAELVRRNRALRQFAVQGVG